MEKIICYTGSCRMTDRKWSSNQLAKVEAQVSSISYF